MNQQKLAYEIAKKEMSLKVHEVFGTENNPQIVNYHGATTLLAQDDETPWCSAFINWCFIVAGLVINAKEMTIMLEESGIPSQRIGHMREHAQLYAEYWAAFITDGAVVLPTLSALARSFLAFGNETTNPKEGDLVIFKRKGSPQAGHVGFFVGKTHLGTMIKVLGGNQKNEINISNYLAINVLGYRTLTSLETLALSDPRTWKHSLFS